MLTEPVGEGTHFRIPWVQQPNIMDIRTRPRTISSVTGTKGKPILTDDDMGCCCVRQQPLRLSVSCAARADLQMVNMSLRILSKPDEPRLPHIFKVRGGALWTGRG